MNGQWIVAVTVRDEPEGTLNYLGSVEERFVEKKKHAHKFPNFEAACCAFALTKAYMYCEEGESIGAYFELYESEE